MLTASVSPRGAGVAAAIEGLSKHLDRLGHETRIFSLADELWAEASNAWTGAQVIPLNVLGPRSIGYAPASLKELSAFVPDIIHVHGLWMHPSRVAFIYRKRTGCPYIVSPHGMLSPHALKYSSVKKQVANYLYQKRSLKAASAFHATSKDEASQIRDYDLKQPISLFPNGIDMVKGVDAEKEKTVLSLGRLHPVKGLDVLIQAWAKLEVRHPEWRLRIIGPCDGGYSDYLRSLAAETGCSRVAIEPPLYGYKKLEVMARAAVFALPSHTENFGLTVIESLMMETPVVASQGTPWSELCTQQCGAWVEGTPASFEVALDRFMEMSAEERRTYGTRGRVWVDKEFSWKSVARIAEKEYQRFIQSPK